MLTTSDSKIKSKWGRKKRKTFAIRDKKVHCQRKKNPQITNKNFTSLKKKLGKITSTGPLTEKEMRLKNP